MKKTDEKILKYLSGMMSDSETISFEKEISDSEQLNKRYYSLVNQLEKFTPPNTIEADERYFANILPRVHQKLEKSRKTVFWKGFYYVTPSAAAAVVLALMLFSSKAGFDTQYKELANEVVQNFSDNDVSEKYFSDLEGSPADIILNTNSEVLNLQIPGDVELSKEAYNQFVDNFIAEDYKLLNGLSENELEIIYEKFNTTTPQKVSK